MNAKKTAHELLLTHYNENKRVVEIDFDNALYGATDYLEKMAEADLGLEVGTVFKSITGVFNSRKIVGVVTPVGNIVFFERFTDGQNGVVVVNVPFALAGIIPTGYQQPEHMELMLGDYRGVSTNIGKTLARVVNVVNNKPIFDKVERIVYVEEFEEVKSHGDVIKDILSDDAKDKLNDVLALAATEPNDPQAVDITEVMDRVETFLREANFKSDVDPVRIEELANMLPETGYRYRAARLALIAASQSNINLTDLMVVLRTCTQEEVSKWAVSAIDNQLTGGRATIPSSNRS